MILAAAAALALVACAKVETIQNVENREIGFGVYVPMTKAGTPGTITTAGANSTTSLQATGFGVFATYSDHADYSASIGPNFMYNTKVSGAGWTYDPVKYWPNETITDSNNAHGPSTTDADKLSFFAYAPWVGKTDGTNAFDGSTTEGITALTANNATTDPKVTYTLSTTPNTAVDLVWAVAGAGLTYSDVHGATVSVTEGMPIVNLTKPAHDYVIPFLFKHATSRLGLKIQGAFDQVAVGGDKDAKTKVTVKSVTLSFPAYTSAVLNLNNTAANTPEWESQDGDSATTVFTVEGSNLNDTIIDTDGAIPQTVEGVTNAEKNLLKDNNTFFTLIPRTDNTTVRVTITYYVTTADAALVGGGSRVENVIYKDITFASGFAAGKANTIKINLGLTSVKLSAEVDDWDVVADTPVDLPKNK